MALAHQSISTINSPQFINLSPLDINPLISSCDIKVFYLGENRNGSFIDKSVAMEMAKTLRGVPIVGYYKKDKEDFTDHGEQVIFDNDGIHFNCLTNPYGFVAPNAEVWFKDFEEMDQKGNSVIRTYLMTKGFLWTGQFQEAQQIFKDNGKPQSMELDKKTIKGHWTKKINDELELFIINDAIFSKLCILGDETEPCFEGAGIVPETEYTKHAFALDDKFKHTLFNMMEQLAAALNGGKKVIDTKQNITDTSEQKVDELTSSFVKKEEDEKEKPNTSEEEKKEQTPSSDEEKEKEKKKKEEDKYALLEKDFEELKSKYSVLQQEYEELKNFKLSVEDKEKDQLINQFNMLSNEDKKDVIENKTKYTLEEIKSKLAVICFEKKINFVHQNEEKEPEEKTKNDVITTFTIETQQNFEIPEWVQAVENTMNTF